MKHRFYFVSIISIFSIILIAAAFPAADVNAFASAEEDAFASDEVETFASDEVDAADAEEGSEPAADIYPAPGIALVSNPITVEEGDAVFVEGTVSIGAGQDICVCDAEGEMIYGQATVEISDSGAAFSIPVDAELLKPGDNNLLVRSLPIEGVIDGSEAAVTISLPKLEQTITAGNLTFKEGKRVKIKASVDSGLPLKFVSAKPRIATVNASGTVTGKRGGSVKITIKQEGDDEHNPAKKTITVKIIPTTYRIVFNPAGGKGEPIEQAIKPGKKVKLQSNKFKREGYKFLGWATASGKAVTTNTDVTKFKNVNMKHFQLGKVKYKNRASVKNLAKVGKTVQLYAVWKGTGPAAAADWARLVARDNNFGYNLFGGHHGKEYGKKHRAGKKRNKFGCYFCRTNTMSKKYCWRGGKTYVCMTFVNAAYAHGANCKTFWKKNKTCKVLYVNGKANIARVKKESKALKCIGHPTVAKAKKGDILVKNNWHVMIYAGKINNKYYIAEASTETGISTAGYGELTMNKIFKEYTVFRLK